MDNDNEIELKKNSTEKELMLFLGEELESLRRSKRVKVYDLETEYAKTSRNKLWSIWITLIVTLVAVALITVFVVNGLSWSNEKIDVNLSSFEDLNLQSLFDQLQRTQDKFDEASKRRAELQGALKAKLSRAKMKMDSDLALLENTRLSKSVLSDRRQKIQNDYKDEVSAAHEELDASLASAEAEVKQYEEQLKNYDSQNVARAKEWEQQMDSQRQLHQLEKKQLVDFYEGQLEDSKKILEETRRKDFEDRAAATKEITRRYEAEIATYDPVFKDLKTSRILSAADAKPAGVFDVDTVVAQAGGAALGEAFAATLKDVQSSSRDLDFLYSKSASIPQRNTMKKVVDSQKKLSYDITNSLAAAAVSEIKAKDAEISTLKAEAIKNEQKVKAALEQRDAVEKAGEAYVAILNGSLVDDRTSGFVLDPANSRGIAVFIRDAYLQGVSRDGSTKVDVYSGRSKYTSGSIMYAEGNYYISLDDDNDKSRVSVGDTFRIKK